MKLNSTCTFNKIYILDAPVKPGESKSGKDLYGWLKNRVQLSGITCERLEITSKKSLVKALHGFGEEDEGTGMSPLLHFEAHGNTKGIAIRPGEILDWEMLLPLTRRINVATNNNLALSFAVCHAGFLYGHIDIFKPAPFFGFVGSIEELNFGATEVGYNAFFDNMLHTKSLNKALHALNADYEQGSMEYGRVPVKKQMFDFRLAEKFFEDLWLTYLKEWDNKAIRSERIQKQMILALQDPATKYRYSIPALRYALEQINTEEYRFDLKRQARAVFMME